MKLITKISLTYSLLLVIALIFMILSVWGAKQSELHLKRAHLAHRTYEANLRLSNYTYRLFKKFADALLIGDKDEGKAERKLIEKMRKEINNLRELITEELKIFGRNDIIELASLGDIEIKIENIINEYNKFIKTYGNDINDDKRALTHILEHTINEKFNSRIQNALDKELLQVDKSINELYKLVNRFTLISLIAGLVAALITAFSLYLMFKRIKRPMEAITEGANRYSKGDWAYRIDTIAYGELREIITAFNNAATAAEKRQAELFESKGVLEREVKARTLELREALLRLEEQAKERQQLLADVSHELRTPLTIIRGEASIALRGEEKSPEEYREALRRTIEAAEHTSTLVNDVLFIARQEAGVTRLNKTEDDLIVLVNNTIKTMENTLRDKNIQVDFLSDVETAKFSFDINRVRQVLLILIENACHYGGDRIDIRLYHTPDGYSVSIKDNGPGIDNGETAQIFSRFFRGSNASERYNSGTGLGLPVAKSIIEAHNGDISVISEPGQGAEFRFILPNLTKLKVVS